MTAIEQLLEQRIVILDGAMGTMIQQRRLDEAGFRGERFRDWSKDLKGHNDLLNLTQPAVIEEIHRQYLEAGADIIETNTFNSQAISLGDYQMQNLAYELSKAGAECARRAVAATMGAQPERRCFVAGAIGPTTKTSSISTDVNNPGARATTYDELVAAYAEQVRGLLDGGVDLLIVRLRRLGEERRDRHDHPRLAVAALRDLMGDPRLLHGVQRAARGQSFDGGDGAAVSRRNRERARPNGAAVQVHRARPACRDPAAELGAGQAEGFADRP